MIKKSENDMPFKGRVLSIISEFYSAGTPATSDAIAGALQADGNKLDLDGVLGGLVRDHLVGVGLSGFTLTDAGRDFIEQQRELIVSPAKQDELIDGLIQNIVAAHQGVKGEGVQPSRIREHVSGLLGLDSNDVGARIGDMLQRGSLNFGRGAGLTVSVRGAQHIHLDDLSPR